MALPSLRGVALSASSLLLVTATAASAQDAFEPNDDCVTPPLLTHGTTTGLELNPDDDYFTIHVPANAHLVIDAEAGAESLNLMLFEVACGTMRGSVSGEPLEYFDCGGTARDLVLFVPSTGSSIVTYELTVTATSVVDDELEDSDACVIGIPARIATFTTPDLFVTGCDDDYYVARLERAGVDLKVDLLFDHSQGDIDVELWDEGCNVLLDSSTSTTDFESVSYTNDHSPSEPENVTIRVFMKNGEGFAPYDLIACFGDGFQLPTVGQQTCVGVVNSSGRPATLCGRGSDVASENDLYLYVVDLPSSSAGYLLTSPNPGFTANPAGSYGNLCLTNPARYSYDPLYTYQQAAVFYEPDLTAVPVAGGGFTSVTAGMRHLWQYWYRDSVGGQAVSNFSSTLCIDFQ